MRSAHGLLSVLALGLVVGLVPAGAATSPQAHAQTAEHNFVQTTLTLVEPGAPQPGDQLVLAGTLRNVSTESLRDVTVFVRYSRDPLEERSDVRRVVDDPDFRSGRRDSRFGRVLADTLEPGNGLEWRIELPVDQLRLSDPGVYVVGIDVRANRSSGSRITAGQARTVLPWLTDSEPPKVPVTLLWPLSATQPSVAPDGQQVDDELAAEITSGGRLRELLAAANGSPVTWLVDADLLASLEAMTHGYTVVAGSESIPGTGERDAASWLSAYQAATSGAEVLGVPYGDPDVSALAAADPAGAAATMRSAITEARAVLEQLTPEAAAVEIVTRPAGGAASESAVAAIAAADDGGVILSSTGVRQPESSPRASLDSEGTKLPAVVTDSGLDDALRDAAGASDPDTGALDLRQRTMAETAMAALEAAEAGDEAPEPLVAAPPQYWRPDSRVAQTAIAAWTTTPWIEPIPLSSVPDDTRDLRPRYPDQLRDAELPNTYLDAAARTSQAGQRLLSAISEPGDLPLRLTRTDLRLVSAAWRANPDGADRFVRYTRDYFDSLLARIQLRVPDSVTLSSRSGRFPITVENRLARPVRVQITLTPANQDRLTTQPVDVVEVGAGERRTIDVYAQATSNGRTPVNVAMATTDGLRLGEVQQVVVVATDYGTIGWFVVVGAGALLVGAAVFRVVRQGKTRRRTSAAPPVVVEEEEVG